MKLDFKAPRDIVTQARQRVAELSLEDIDCEPVEISVSDDRYDIVTPQLHACPHDQDLLDEHETRVEECHASEAELFEEGGECRVCGEDTAAWYPDEGDYHPEPRLNLGWPVQFDDARWGLTAQQAANHLACSGRFFCVVGDRQTGGHFLVGQGCGMDFSWAMVHDFVLVGRCPPTYLCLPHHAGARATLQGVTAVLALQRSHEAQAERSLESIQNLARLARRLRVSA